MFKPETYVLLFIDEDYPLPDLVNHLFPAVHSNKNVIGTGAVIVDSQHAYGLIVKGVNGIKLGKGDDLSKNVVFIPWRYVVAIFENTDFNISSGKKFGFGADLTSLIKRKK